MKTKGVTIGIVLSSLFAALISVASFIQIPLGAGVPIAIQDMLSLLAGMLLGPLYGTIAVLVFLLLGILGLPVFTGKAGIQVILYSPTGGFIVGYLVGAIAVAFFLKIFLPQKPRNKNQAENIEANSDSSKKSTAKTYIFITIASLLGNILVFVFGILGFIRITQKDFLTTLKLVLLPFIPGNTIKMILMIFLTKKFRPIIYNYIHSEKIEKKAS